MSETLLITLCGSSVLVAVIGLVGNIVMFKMNRKAKKEDENREDENKVNKLDQRVSTIEKTIEEHGKWSSESLKKINDTLLDLKESQRVILYDRILQLSQEYITNQDISYNQRKDLHMMHSIYHNQLGGNGDLDAVMKDVDEIKVDYEDD